MTELAGASVWEQEIYEFLCRHVEKEQDVLAQYAKEAESSESKAFQYLVGLIMEEERVHHRRFLELAESLRASVTWDAEPVVPRLERWGPLPEQVVEATEHLIAEERADVKELHDLEQRLRVVKDTTLWQLLVRLMSFDTEKHLLILNFVRDHARHPDRF